MNEDQLSNGPATPSEQPTTGQPIVNGQMPQNPQPFVSGDMSQNPQTFTGGQPAPQQAAVGGFQSSPMPPQGSGKSSKKPLIIIGVIVLIVILAIVGFFVFANGDNDSLTEDKSASESIAEIETTEEKKAATTADSIYDYNEVCSGGSISNAPEYVKGQKSMKVVAFTKSRTYDSYSEATLSYDKSFYADSEKDISNIPVVACLEYVEGSDTKGKVCEYDDIGSIDIYSYKYSLAYYSAKTGEKVADGPEVDVIASRCPGFLSYDKEKKSAYASIDKDVLSTAISGFVGQ